jgi:hypothetical protein
MDAHRLAELRSIEMHRRVAEELRGRPTLLDDARARVESWAARPGVSPYYADAWRKVLALPLPDLCAFLVDEGEHATRLRQASPFAGALDPRERWRIWREVRARASAS